MFRKLLHKNYGLLKQNYSIKNSLVKTTLVNPATKEERLKYATYVPEIIDHLTEKKINTQPLSKLYKNILEYNVIKDFEVYGILVVNIYKHLETNLSEENLRLANVMGLCVELLQTSLLMTDDLVDGGETRGGAPCWYKFNKNGLKAVSHARLVEFGIYPILKKYFSDSPYYKQMVEMFHLIGFYMFMGVAVEALYVQNNTPQLHLFTVDNQQVYGKLKTADVTYYLPLILASYLTGCYNERYEKTTRIIANRLGYILEAWNDVLDCYGDSTVTGKQSTDVARGTCSWLIVKALEKATPGQRELIKNNYGKPGIEAMNAIHNLYEEMNLLKCYFEYESKCIEEIQEQIRLVPNENEHNAYSCLLNNLTVHEPLN